MTTFLSILENYSEPLAIQNKTFFNEHLSEEILECSYFLEVTFSNCSFNKFDLLGVEFYSCVFQNCHFSNTLIRKSDFIDCEFINCEFPRLFAIQTIFTNNKFSRVDFTNTTLTGCKLITVEFDMAIFQNTVFASVKTKDIKFNKLEFLTSNALKFYNSKEDYKAHKPIIIVDLVGFQKHIAK